MRKPRITQKGAIYHVAARTNRKELLMEPDAVKQMFVDVLARAKAKFSFRLDNFVIMGNHFHLLIEPQGDSTLPNIMKWILQTLAIRYNKANGLSGHFWGDRYFSWIVPSAREFLRVFSYLDQNPVAAGLVKAAEEWKWGALWLRQNGIRWLGSLPRWLVEVFPHHCELVGQGQTSL